MTKTRLAAGLLGVALAAAAAPVACGARTDTNLAIGAGASGGGTGSSSGSFPFGGPSCDVTQGCWSCLQNACFGIGCLATDCASYFGCLCACTPGDGTCASGCDTDITTACVTCQQSLGTCTNGCLSQCSNSGAGNGSGSSSSSGGAGSGGGGSSGGSLPGETVVCTGSVEQCSEGRALEFCQDLLSMNCTAAYYEVGTQSFPCASCSDTLACANAASGACQ